MGNFIIPEEYRWRGARWVNWYTPKGQQIFVMLEDRFGGERCVKHCSNLAEYQKMHSRFCNDIAPKIDADIFAGSSVENWETVTKVAVTGPKQEWTYVFNYQDGGLILFHMNPPGYQYDQPFVGSIRHQQWFDNASGNLNWPFR